MIFKGILLQLILTFFSVFMYLVFLIYIPKLSKKSKELVLRLCLIISVIFIFAYNDFFYTNLFCLFINIPLVIAFHKKDKVLAIILSLFIIGYYCYFYNFNIYLMILEYLSYYIVFIYFIDKKRVINFFTGIKGLVLSYELYSVLIVNYDHFNIFFLLLYLIVTFCIITQMLTTLLNKGEEIIEAKGLLKELEKERTLKKSLFKITHELKNPIAVCKGYLDMMDYSDWDKTKKYNNIIKSELNRTLAIMDDFSLYSKLKVEMDIVDINLLLEDIRDSFKEYLRLKNVDSRIEIKDKEIFIYADYNRLKQVFLNIIKNSVEAIDNNGLVEIRIKERKSSILITIKDNGKGMNQETLSQIGEDFFTTKQNGTGMGVSFVKEVIELHKGKVKYSSKINMGTTVSLILPKIKEA